MNLQQSRVSRLVAVLLLTICAVSASATIRYTVRPLPESKQVAVQIAIPTTSSETLVQCPRWMPGFYALQEYSRNLKDFAATGADGKSAEVDVVDDHTWKIHGSGTVTLSYKANLEFDNGIGHYSGAPTYIYVEGRTQEPCTLHLDLPKDWKLAIGLDGSGADYHAPTYDVLADNPVTMGNFIEETYQAAGRTHILALRGAGANQIDRALLRKECEFISNMETDFMGGAPYKKYVWHLNVRPGRGGGSGLEHLAGTEITVAADITPRTAGLFAHEFFHLWNVKRIRSRVLGPFDYTQLPKTGALWWLEGVTEYYAQSLLCRYGWETPTEYYAEAGRDVSNLRSVPARLTVSPYDSSFRVDEAAGGRGNSNGFGVSYYDDGFVVGLCLDIELLSRTHGKRSLDDVIQALWRECRNSQPGFAEDGIRRQLIAVGGPDFGPIYDRLVTTPGELPVEQELARVGLELATHMDARPDVGFLARPSLDRAGMEVTETKSPEIAAMLPAGTVIRSINGHAIEGATTQALRRSYLNATAGIAVGGELKLRVVAPGQDKEADLTLHAISVPITVTQIKPVAAPEPEQMQLLALLIAKHRK